MLVIEKIKKLTPSNLPNLTILTGDDVGQLEILKEQFFKQIHFDSSDLNTTIFDMKETNYSDVELDLVSLPFFDNQKMIILDHFIDLTTSKKRYLTDAELQSFEKYLENPSETTKLIIFAEGKLDGKRRIVKRMKQDGGVFEATALKEADLRAYFINESKQMQLHFSENSFEELLIKSGFQFSEISKNLVFLKSYKKNNRIEVEDIQQAIPKTLQDNIFDLIQLIVEQKLDKARSLIRDLTLQGEDEIKLIAIMLSQFRTFIQVKILSTQHKSESQIVSELSDYLGRKMNPYQVKFALRDSRMIELSFLKKAIACLIKTDYQIKSGLYDKSYLFDLAVLKLVTRNL